MSSACIPIRNLTRHTVRCAAFIPPEGIESEQVGSSPEGSHAFVVATDAGSGF